jgi:hypothetical protein
MVSNQSTTQLKGYQLIYLNASGKRVVDPTLINLNPGWNLITRTINGTKTTFFVYGGVLPTVSPSAVTSPATQPAGAMGAAALLASPSPTSTPSTTTAAPSRAVTRPPMAPSPQPTPIQLSGGGQMQVQKKTAGSNSTGSQPLMAPMIDVLANQG